MCPVARICPAANVQAHIRPARVFDGLGDRLVACLFVKRQVILIVTRGTAAEIDLDEVEAHFIEKEITVLLVMSVEAHALTRHITIEHATAGVLATVGVDARLHPLFVNVIHYRLEPVWKTGWMNQQLTCIGVATSKVTIIDVDVVKAYVQQTLVLHGICLPFDDVFADTNTKGVP